MRRVREKAIELINILNKKNAPNTRRFTQTVLKNDLLKGKVTIENKRNSLT